MTLWTRAPGRDVCIRIVRPRGGAAFLATPMTSLDLQQEQRPPIRDAGSRWIDFMFAAGAATLFFHAEVDIHVYRDLHFRAPLNAPLMVATAVLALVGFVKRSTLFASMSWTLLAFVTMHVASAFRLGGDNGVREMIQAAMVFAFALAFGARYSRASVRRFYLFFTPMAAAIMAYNIGWHVQQGYYFMWKRLYNPKALFDLLPLLITGWLLTRQKFPLVQALVFMVAAGGIILLSGERKAYIAFIIAIALMLNPKNVGSYLVPIAAGVLVYIGIKLSGSQYVLRQVQTLLATIGIGPMPDSLSSTEREWQIHLGLLFLRQNPLFGVGTNGFMRISQALYSANDFSQIGIHGEALRVLVEDGILGLCVYVVFVFSSAVQIIAPEYRAGRTSGEQRIAVLWFLSLLVYTSFEGSNLLLMAMQYSMAFVGKINFGRDDRAPLRSRQERASAASQEAVGFAHPALAAAR